MAAGEPRKRDKRAISEKTVYEPQVALRRNQSALLALVIITATGVLVYMVFEGWSFTDALYMTVITLTTVGYREVRELDTTGQVWTMVLLVTGWALYSTQPSPQWNSSWRERYEAILEGDGWRRRSAN
jgi:ion channel